MLAWAVLAWAVRSERPRWRAAAPGAVGLVGVLAQHEVNGSGASVWSPRNPCSAPPPRRRVLSPGFKAGPQPEHGAVLPQAVLFRESWSESLAPAPTACDHAHHLASGLISCGWSQIKVGFTHCSSRNSPTSLSSSRAVVCGHGEATDMNPSFHSPRATQHQHVEGLRRSDRRGPRRCSCSTAAQVHRDGYRAHRSGCKGRGGRAWGVYGARGRWAGRGRAARGRTCGAGQLTLCLAHSSTSSSRACSLSRSLGSLTPRHSSRPDTCGPRDDHSAPRDHSCGPRALWMNE